MWAADTKLGGPDTGFKGNSQDELHCGVSLGEGKRSCERGGFRKGEYEEREESG